ncbi:MAG TPA: isoprenylcysteine carboxylmethyltransferase family protein, partial [Noviherbaspirillum sp.]|nr:isoprenylcysteine carboxylmethyltransferase family protein [Noviherbaspirillum sp.]
MGRRGEAWVIAQGILFIMFAIAPSIGPAWNLPDAVTLIAWALVISSVLFLAWSARTLGRSLTPFPRPLPEGKLVTSGAYRLVRHPIYCAVIIGAFGLTLISENWLRLAMTGILFIFFDMKARREEVW